MTLALTSASMRSIHGPHSMTFSCDDCGRSARVARNGRVDQRSWSLSVAIVPERWRRMPGSRHRCNRCVRAL